MDNHKNPVKLTVDSRLQINIKATGFDWSTNVLFENGPMDGTFRVFLICTDLPLGSKVSLVCDAGGPNPPIFIPDTVVTMSGFMIGLISHIPANFRATFTIRAWFSQSTLSPSASICPSVERIRPLEE